MNSNDWATGGHWYDDIFLDDLTGEAIGAKPVPRKRFSYLTPNANGTYSGWLGSDGNSADNYQLVDEVPLSTSDYVETDTVTILDGYNMTTRTMAGTEGIIALIPGVYGKRDVGNERVAIGTRISSTDLIGSDQDPSGVTSYLWERQETKPGGGDWDQSSIDSHELLIRSGGTF
jgi:hypothetical protein